MKHNDFFFTELSLVPENFIYEGMINLQKKYKKDRIRLIMTKISTAIC